MRIAIAASRRSGSLGQRRFRANSNRDVTRESLRDAASVSGAKRAPREIQHGSFKFYAAKRVARSGSGRPWWWLAAPKMSHGKGERNSNRFRELRILVFQRSERKRNGKRGKINTTKKRYRHGKCCSTVRKETRQRGFLESRDSHFPAQGTKRTENWSGGGAGEKCSRFTALGE